VNLTRKRIGLRDGRGREQDRRGTRERQGAADLQTAAQVSLIGPGFACPVALDLCAAGDVTVSRSCSGSAVDRVWEMVVRKGSTKRVDLHVEQHRQGDEWHGFA
jgi:hypothetical protein